MFYNLKTAIPLTFIMTLLSSILLLKIYQLIRSSLVWRVNCWFCNTNCWVNFIERNCWTCAGCEQYNGFTKDGDYNRTMHMNSDFKQNYTKLFSKSPPRNGLCKMCNVNQQLKVTQLANFVPTNEKKFDDEIEFYRAQLEKAYKLCSPCKKVLTNKLRKEKESLLGLKLLEDRTPEKKQQEKENMKNKLIKSVTNRTTIYMCTILLILVLIELSQNLRETEKVSSGFYNFIIIIQGLSERVFTIFSLKINSTFPDLQDFLKYLMFFDFSKFTNKVTSNEFQEINALTQQVLGGIVCFIQIIGQMLNTVKTKNNIFTDLLWTLFEMVAIVQHSKIILHESLTLMKLLTLCLILIEYNIHKVKIGKDVKTNKFSPMLINKKKLGFTQSLRKSVHDSEESLAMETDDDVSLCKFGVQNLTDSSTDANSPFNNSFMNGRSFTPRNDSYWCKPKLNSTFCVNSVTAKSPSCNSETIFVKPSFDKYQKLQKDDSDSDLDESISSLTIGTKKKTNHKNNAMFSLRKFSATPNFLAPTPLNRSRPLISPSKLGHNTSWVAGGYWGSDEEHKIFNVNGSRSSSQSSGFESQASSMNQRNIFSQTPSREESICGDSDKTTVLLDPFQSCSMNNFRGYLPQQAFSPINSPVFPQMQFNNHVQIPQPRFAQQQSLNAFRKPNFVQNSMFRAPGGSGLINLSRVNSFTH